MTLGQRLRNWKDAVRSFGLAARASRHLGRSHRLRRAGRVRDALRVARDGLSLLDAPVIRRQESAEGALLVTLTIQVEVLAQEIGERGAGVRDLLDLLANA